MIGLYVHVPFCVRKCHYCDFVIAPSGDARLRMDYLTALAAEAAEARRRHGPIEFDTVYLGGGTPSALTVGEMKQLFETLRENFGWKPDAEVTCEVNPGDVDEAKLLEYRRQGVNRVSIGVQSTQDRLLRAMNRVHTTEDSRRTAELVQSMGFRNISMDLIIRLPNQKVEDVRDSLKNMVEWNTHQIVIYDLNVHQNTHFGQLEKQGKLSLPPEATHEAMFRTVEDYLENAGFDHYEVASFAKPGFESRHNLIYWHNRSYLGLGPGAFSYMGGKRSVHSQSVARYLDKARRSEWDPDENEVLSPEDQDMETLMTGLRLKAGVSLDRLPAARSAVAEEIPALAAEGLIEYDAPVIRLTRKGRYLAESVFVRLSRKSVA